MLERLKYKFNDKNLLRAALTHRSASGPKKMLNESDETDNQRLEFLGDAVLELFISDYLFHCPHKMAEGEMSRIRAALVCEARLTDVAKRLRLGEAIILGPGEAGGGGRHKPSVLADALEALLGAIYLDGGIEAAFDETRRLWKPFLGNCHNWEDIFTDYKTRLQEETQKRGFGTPHYQLVSAEGPDHARFFTMSVHLGNDKLAQGTAGSKKEAEQKAAQEAIDILLSGTLDRPQGEHNNEGS